jgi:hypothetical protein
MLSGLSNASKPGSGQHLHIFARVCGRGRKRETLPTLQGLAGASYSLSNFISHSFQLSANLASVSAALAAPVPSNVANSVGTYKEEHPIYNGRDVPARLRLKALFEISRPVQSREPFLGGSFDWPPPHLLCDRGLLCNIHAHGLKRT